MSNIPKLRFKEFKEPWKENKLQNIGSISMCKRVLKKDTNEIGDIPFYKIGTFGKKADAYISNDYFKTLKEKYKYPKKGDILLSAAGTIGRTVEFDGLEAYFQDSNIVWLNNNEKIIQNKFLHLLYNNLNWVSQDTTIKRLVNSTINSTVINYPKDIKEQEKIATFINSVDTYINQLDEKENLMEEYIKGVNQQIFSQKIRFKKDDGSDYEDWKHSHLGDVKTNTIKSSGIKDFKGNKSYLSTSSISSNKVQFIEEIITKDKRPSRANMQPEINDVVFAKMKDTNDKNIVIDKDLSDNCILSTGFMLLKPNIKTLNSFFLLNYLNNTSFINLKNSLSAGGSQKGLNNNNAKKIRLPLPCIEEQEKIANFLQSLNQELLNIREEKELTKEFKKGLLQQMFV